MVIRRASDSTTTTIGFDGSGNISEADIISFCTGTTCTVYQWLDQSGNGNTATAAAPANEPTIYTGGALVKDNGKVAVEFSNDTLTLDSSITTNALCVFSMHVDGSNQYFPLRQGTTNYVWFHTSFGQLRALMGGTFAIDSYSSKGTMGLRTFIKKGTSGNEALNYVDGFNITTGGYDTLDTETGTFTTLGAYTGKSQEVIVYTSDKSGVRTDIEENVGDYFTQNTPLLDTYSGAAAAYSLRKLSSSYSGPAIRVRRDNDNSETDINFNVFGELDTVSLAAHCGSNNGYVTNWYDQSSNSNTARQTTAANQPKIYDGTTGVVTENGKPAVENVLSGAQGLNIPSFTINLSDFTCTLVSKFYADSGTEGRPIMINGDLLASYDYRYKQFSIARGKFYLGTSTVQSFFNNVSYTSTNNLQLHTITPTNGYVDGTSAGTFGTAGEDLDLNPAFNYLTSGDIGRDRGTHANTSEVIIWTADQTGNRAGIETNIATFYDITI